MKKVRLELVRSSIGHPKDQKATLKALKLTKMHRVVEFEATPQIMGMVNKVKHLLVVEEL
jgi:large subunit ribosomal protein L30